MLSLEQLTAYCLGKDFSYVDYPFGPNPACIKVKGKIFAEIYGEAKDYKITLKCDPILADVYRHQYPGVVVRGYHCPPSQQPHRNTIWVEKMEGRLLCHMIDHSYDLVVKSLPLYVKKTMHTV